MRYRCQSCGDKVSTDTVLHMRRQATQCGDGSHKGPFSPLLERYATRYTVESDLNNRKAVDDA